MTHKIGDTVFVTYVSNIYNPLNRFKLDDRAINFRGVAKIRSVYAENVQMCYPRKDITEFTVSLSEEIVPITGSVIIFYWACRNLLYANQRTSSSQFLNDPGIHKNKEIHMNEALSCLSIRDWQLLKRQFKKLHGYVDSNARI